MDRIEVLQDVLRRDGGWIAAVAGGGPLELLEVQLRQIHLLHPGRRDKPSPATRPIGTSHPRPADPHDRADADQHDHGDQRGGGGLLKQRHDQFPPVTFAVSPAAASRSSTFSGDGTSSLRGSWPIATATQRNSSLLSSTTFRIIVSGTARTMPIRPHNQPQNSTHSTTTRIDRPKRFPSSVGCTKLSRNMLIRP